MKGIQPQVSKLKTSIFIYIFERREKKILRKRRDRDRMIHKERDTILQERRRERS